MSELQTRRYVPDEGKNLKRVSDLFLLLALGAQTMIVELVIPRLIAPTFGNTIFCWTAIIAVVLIALAVGYDLGGRLANERNANTLIGIFGTSSALWVIGLSLLGGIVTTSLSGLGMMLGPLVVASLLAAFPAGCGAAVVPLIVHTRSVSAARAAGQCYAWSTIGSVLGVLLTGYVLLPQLGISRSMLTGALLAFLALLFYGRWWVGMAGLVVSMILVIMLPTRREPGVLFDRSNGYHRIRILEVPDARVRMLLLDQSLQGAVQLGSPEPVVPYQKKISEIARGVPQASSALFIGGGTFSMPRSLKADYPNAVVDVIEIDPDIVAAASEYLELPEELNVFVGDGRRVLQTQATRYDLIVHDAFSGVRTYPFHLVTRDFNRLVSERLTPRGLYAINVAGHPTDSRLVRSLLRTLREDFPHVTFLYDAAGSVQNMWILAGRSPLSVGEAPPPSVVQEDILTDDHAPIEFLVAKDLVRGR